jgi:hypothetical protein
VSRSLSDWIAASGYFSIIATSDRSADLDRALDERDATVTIEIPPRFAADIASGRGAGIQVLVDGTDSNTGNIALSPLPREPLVVYNLTRRNSDGLIGTGLWETAQEPLCWRKCGGEPVIDFRIERTVDHDMGEWFASHTESARSLKNRRNPIVVLHRSMPIALVPAPADPL